MTPAITAAKKLGITFKIHEYQHDPDNTAFGLEAAEKLGLDTNRVFKTLVVSLDQQTLAVAIIPVAQQLNMKLMAKACGHKKAQMADKQKVVTTTGYVLGGVSPLGQKKPLQTVMDISAENWDTLYVSAGKRGLEIELSPADLQQATRASLHPLCND